MSAYPQRKGFWDSGHIDPLTKVRTARCRTLNAEREATDDWTRRSAAGERRVYDLYRSRAFAPVLGQLRMIEAAIGCYLACRRAVQAWRNAA